MDRDQQLKYCSKCKHKKMDLNKGLLCGLTDKYADFEGACKDFEKSEEKVRVVHGSASSKTLRIEETNSKPAKYWNYLGYSLLTATVIGVIQAALHIWRISSEGDWNDYWHLLTVALWTAAVWTFVGLELNNLKHGLIAAGISFATYILFWLVPFPELFLWHYVPTATAAVYFGLQTMANRDKILKFVLLCLVIMAGVGTMYSFSQVGLSEDVGGIMRWVFGIHNDLDSGFLTWGVTDGEWTSNYSLDWVFGAILSSTFAFLSITYLFQVLEGKQKWGFQLISLGRRISKKKMVLYVFVFYTGIALLSLGTMGSVLFFFEWQWNTYWGAEANYNDYIPVIISLFSGLVLLTFMVGLYRKILLEYYIDRGQSISWNFYFGQLPIIGLIVWLTNFAAFELSENISVRKMEALKTRSHSLAGFLVFIVVLYMLTLIGLASNLGGRIDVVAFGIMFFGVSIYILYLYHDIGIYILVGIQMLGFLVVVFLQLFDTDIPTGALSKWVFWSMSQAFLLYPCFHLNVFKVEIFNSEKQVDNEVFEEIDIPID